MTVTTRMRRRSVLCVYVLWRYVYSDGWRWHVCAAWLRRKPCIFYVQISASLAVAADTNRVESATRHRWTP